jgi:hypothetical protein
VGDGRCGFCYFLAFCHQLVRDVQDKRGDPHETAVTVFSRSGASGFFRRGTGIEIADGFRETLINLTPIAFP